MTEYLTPESLEGVARIYVTNSNGGRLYGGNAVHVLGFDEDGVTVGQSGLRSKLWSLSTRLIINFGSNPTEGVFRLEESDEPVASVGASHVRYSIIGRRAVVDLHPRGFRPGFSMPPTD